MTIAATVFDTIDYRGYEINFYYDESPMSPREFSNMGVIIAFHRTYDLCDSEEIFAEQNLTRIPRPSEGTTYKDWLEACGVDIERDVVLPLYGYGDLDLRVGNLDTDFGLKANGPPLGAIVCTYDKICSEYNIETRDKIEVPGICIDISEFFEEDSVELDDGLIPQEVLSKVVSYLTSEVHTYSQYINGDVFGWEVNDPQGTYIDGCSGYFGASEASELKYVTREAELAIDAEIESQRNG